MKRIYKYPLEVIDFPDVAMPVNAELLCIQVQGGQPCLWALVDPDRPLVQRRIRIYSTGQPIEDLEAADYYVGSFHILISDLVYHVFDYGEAGS